MYLTSTPRESEKTELNYDLQLPPTGRLKGGGPERWADRKLWTHQCTGYITIQLSAIASVSPLRLPFFPSSFSSGRWRTSAWKATSPKA
jgi:hypothetical protein